MFGKINCNLHPFNGIAPKMLQGNVKKDLRKTQNQIAQWLIKYYRKP